ncbi:MAG: DUF1405 domain-containing protein, partial [Bacillota bacterium]
MARRARLVAGWALPVVRWWPEGQALLGGEGTSSQRALGRRGPAPGWYDPVALVELVKGIPRDRRWLLFLTVVNLGGFVYGMDWYRGQLASLPVWTWPVVADCPVSALLFGCLTGALALGVAPGALEGLADVAALKYGMWTVLV